MNKLFPLLKSIQRYLKYYYIADTKYQVHSPFVFDFALNVLEDDREFYVFKTVEYLRNILEKNSTEIRTTDFGAGSTSSNQKVKTIGSIAKSAASKKWQCQTLFRLVNFCKPKTMLEMGTSLGVSTIYQASASLNAKLISLEGDPQIAKLANYHLEEFKIKNVDLRVGKFEDTLQLALNDLGKLDYVFVDGNHRLKPTLDYFESCLAFSHNETVFVFDDIHWSDEMELAWEKIKEHPRVTISIDLFHMGIVFIRKEKKVKEHYVLCPLSWKRWKSFEFF
jgi:predicted O-methyltransferase YrrM